MSNCPQNTRQERSRGDADLPQETWERSQSTGREGPSFPSFPALQRGSGYNSTQATLGPQQLDQQRLHCLVEPRQWPGGQAAESSSSGKLVPLCVKSRGWVSWPLSPWRKTDVGWCPQEEGLPRSLF